MSSFKGVVVVSERSKWIQFGDKNTKLFHTTTIIRRRRNQIVALKREDDTWCNDQDERLVNC